MKNILNCWGILSHLNFLGSIFLIYRIWRVWIVKPGMVFPGSILIFLIYIQLTYNVVLVSGVQQSSSVIYTCVCVYVYICVCVYIYIYFLDSFPS